ncbi:tetratricopeptide repeat-containing diguanylate cyclase [Natronospira bacteriovora]|uniref:diguanylate cyclase n=1 Tax=Natronospira bacteriovora TaxID=3069753 RepID=A0ABU0W4Q6_9GAMM|nr:tetratricopeptide repeat-containing diguanylate cyclase [Natronospira sp. AB-CW4]MDQ2069003.1 diguanylate cyclase [Natronospira sp. AB-CW4]
MTSQTGPSQRFSIFPRITASLLLPLLLLSTMTAADIPEVDAELEKRLDQYISLFSATAEERAEVLEAIIGDMGSDTPVATRVRALGYRMLDSATAEDNERAVAMQDELLTLARRSGQTDTLAEAKAFQIELLWRMDDSKEAMVHVPRLETLLPDVRSPRIRYYAHTLTARLLRSHSQYEEALSHFLAAYDAVRETDDERTQVRRQFLNYQIAQLQAELRNFDQALQMAERGIREMQELDYQMYLPEFFLLKGYIFGQMEDHEASIGVHEEAIQWAERLDRPGIVLTSLNNIGSAQIQMQDYSAATQTLERALDMALELENESTRPLLEFNLAYLAIMQGAGSESIADMEAARSELEAFYGQADMADLLGYVADAYRAAGYLDEAIDTLIEQRDMNAELFQSERDKSLNELQIRYETREQATQIELLEQRNELQERVIENSRLQQRITILFVAVVVLSLILLWQAYRAARRANLRLTVANRKLEYQSVHDTLTGLLNRRSFQKEMQKRGRSGIERRAQAHPDALLLLDVDYFKRINDRHGHAGGDVVLKELARRLKSVTRESDMVIRWGGEEILLFLRNMSPDALPDHVQKMLNVIAEEPIIYDDRRIQVTATGGFIQLPFAGVPEDDIDWEKALHIADMALYIGKTHGRNRAIGILGLNCPYETIRDQLSNDLAAAVEQSQVDHMTITGPSQSHKAQTPMDQTDHDSSPRR